MNKFVVFEGLDACGKTTLSSLYAKEMNTIVHNAVVPEAHDLRKVIDSYESKESAFLFFLLNNLLKSNEVSKVLNDEDIILDRYVFSTLAYQIIMLEEDIVKNIFDTLKIYKKILLPEVIIFVKADIETINNRIETRGGTVQWYGDAVTQNNSVESAYHKVFKWFDIPIVEVDTSEKYGRSVEENYLLMKDQVEHVLSGGSNLYSF
ncbi:deoxynucleoside kinase [Vibrio parahaemolyticus]|uniref:deoxynucleoside kinase n=1 Tax=Vibrio parahaemolyticus TaxID=670 RepID=UPI00111E974D|nr:deoxynucleoside kinase [Vibrio parahaemolyticus]MBD2853876.1 deoxynucleoside kinase [Vibrio parahaemolyticus]MBW6449466.1 deoxynucleoside kinase [Vibrio parahaemolyticus]TPA36089.1 thymidylate kinase [Vibrio parahaemolyticus]HAS3129241.1 deoxynucleoside kinase [Vibrio parahaemolyticus]